MKKCIKCGEVKSNGDFFLRRKICIECEVKENRQKRKEAAKRYRENKKNKKIQE